MIRFGAAFLFLLAAACSPRAATTPPPRILPDSIVLDRTRCFGFCPAYELTLSKAGRVSFDDDSTEATDSIAPSAFAALYEEFDRLGFSALPVRIKEQPEFCSRYATDMPSAILTVVTGKKKQTVNDYHGCLGTTDSTKAVLARLRLLEDRVDSVAHSARWVKRPRSR